LLKTIETDKEVITIGRNADNDIQIDNLSVSEDLNSTNGTYLNEKMISKGQMNHQDVVTIGKHTLEFELDKMYSIDTSQEGINDTMMLTTEKHKDMLRRQKKAKKK
jgi:pSer/pThr/pTyr-binding forkhead associated (FHA) protein